MLRASKGLAKRQPGGTLDLCSMHSSHSGNDSFKNIPFFVITFAHYVFGVKGALSMT